jgi:hypothetical protein
MSFGLQARPELCKMLYNTEAFDNLMTFAFQSEETESQGGKTAKYQHRKLAANHLLEVVLLCNDFKVEPGRVIEAGLRHLDSSDSRTQKLALAILLRILNQENSVYRQMTMPSASRDGNRKTQRGLHKLKVDTAKYGATTAKVNYAVHAICD